MFMLDSHSNPPRRSFLKSIPAVIAVLFFCWSAARGQSTGKPIVLPARYDEHRFYVEPVAADGTRLTFYTDTGGGLFLLRDAVERLRLSMVNVGGEGKDAFHLAELPKFRADASIPAPLSRGGRIPVWSPPTGEGGPSNFVGDGMLGQDWFGGRVWQFDYPGRRLLLLEDMPAGDAKHRVSLGFKSDETGKRALNFPRIQVEIDGETLDLLFDTGATTFLVDSALAVLKDGGAAARATSFITNTTFEKWRKEHPDWRVIERAEKSTGEAMIEVPLVTVAGYSVGPVWFTRRADKNFHEYMSGFMDKRVDGALGGNALRHFRVTVDYPGAVAVFQK